MNNSKVLNVLVRIGNPTSDTAVIVVRSGAIDYLLFGKVEDGIFVDHVCAFDGANWGEWVTSATGFLELDRAHFFFSVPVDYDRWGVCWNLQWSNIFIWWNHWNLLVQDLIFIFGLFHSQVNFTELLRCIYDKLVFSEHVRLHATVVVFKDIFSVALYIGFYESHFFASTFDPQCWKYVKITCIYDILFVRKVRGDLTGLALYLI